MVSFYVYDLIFLVLFTVGVVWFLYSHKKNLKREGIMYLYRTQLGVKIIDKLGERHKKLFRVLDWLSIISGYILMVIGIAFLYRIIDIFVRYPSAVRALKVPPITPLIPYLPEIFKIDFLPPFYFTYWIVSLAIIAIGHEFAHGIYARAKGIKIKATGFGFLGPFIAAFVEPDEKKMQKLPAKKQIAVLSAGTFANIVMTGIFFLLMIGFFYAAFTPSGYQFNQYAVSIIPAAQITGYGNYSNYKTVFAENKTFYLDSSLIGQLNNTNFSYLVAYDDAPAIKANLSGAIIQVNNIKINGQKDLQNYLSETKPNQTVSITTLKGTNRITVNLTLATNPVNNSIGYLGIGYSPLQPSGIIGKVSFWFTEFKDPSTLYLPRFDNNFAVFIYNLLWWIVLLNLSVAIINMLPLGIFDGGRVFYLTMKSIFKSEKVAKILFKIATYAILAIVVLMMVLWFIAVR